MIHGDVKETLCSRCSHLQVCSFKQEFIAAQQAVDNICVNFGDRTINRIIKNLQDFDWIEPVALKCIYFSNQLE